MRKSQAALEFLTTYAWAFIALIVSVGALYYFGVIDFSKFLPQKCTFPSELKCVDFSLKPSEVDIRLLNNLGEDIHVTSLSITNDASTPMTCDSQGEFDWQHSKTTDIVFSNCGNGGYAADQRVELFITLTYYAINTRTQPKHSVKGKINGKVTTS